MRIVFFGTPEFAVPTAEALVSADLRPVLVVTQPSRGRGRGRRPALPPVGRWASEHGIEIAQPETVREPAFLERLEAIGLDVAVVVAFGQIFPKRLLDLPRLGCVNLHASLLPRHRGAAPVAAAIRAGDSVTGVSTMLMEAGLDTGPVLLQSETEIDAEETCGELTGRLAHLGAELMVETLERLGRGELDPKPQDDALATLAPRLAKEDGRIDWRADAPALANLVRAMSPWPGASTRLRGAPLSVRRAKALAGESAEAAPGSLLGRRGEALLVSCGRGTVLALLELQRPGKRPVAARDFANGERLEPGERFESVTGGCVSGDPR